MLVFLLINALLAQKCRRLLTNSSLTFITRRPSYMAGTHRYQRRAGGATARERHSHIWWHCEHITPYWDKVNISLIKQITETKANLNMACCLLHVSNFSFQKYKRSLSRHMLNAAKSLLPIHCRSERVPSIVDWLNRVSDIHEMEETLAQANEKIESFHKTWQPWLIFKYYQAYENIMCHRNQ